MKNIKYLLLLSMTFLLQSCFAPLSNDYTARTVGKNKWDASAGISVATIGSGAYQPYVRINYGLTDNLDVGVIGETGNLETAVGLRGKYAFMNNPEGFSWGLVGSAGYAEGIYAYGGPIASYKINWWEPYGIARINYNSAYVGGVYGQFTLGNTLWMTKKLGFTINANYLIGDAIDDFQGTAGLAYRF